MLGVTELGKRILAGAVLGAGTIVLIASLWALLDLARMQQLYSGEVFQRSAAARRWIVVAEVATVILSTAVVLWRRKGAVARLGLVAIVVWLVSAGDFVYLALGGAVPR